MSNTVIKIEDVGKLYKLGEIGTGTISHDLNRWWARVRGKEDPFSKIGEMNDRTSKGESDYVWVLKDINFEVKQGEALGIIGRNGAGKSTLLKILSKVTTPSKGNIKIKGRIASLLEVGTGFHPELTGRENIFLNGAILGMTKAEIRSKFDEIVDFSGVERYIDTPVKRYSSGMYVRLAFAVAAFLEPEILIVDEVLAVGDVEFQKKCIGRMQDVSQSDGRTILFVSHNITAIQKLCSRAVVMKNGTLLADTSVNKAIEVYNAENLSYMKQRLNSGESILQSAKITDKKEVIQGSEVGYILEFEFELNTKNLKENIGIDLTIHHNDSRILFLSSAYYNNINIDGETKVVRCKCGPINFAIGQYKIDVNIVVPQTKYLEEYPSYLTFDIERHMIPLDSVYNHQLFANQDIGLITINQAWSKS